MCSKEDGPAQLPPHSRVYPQSLGPGKLEARPDSRPLYQTEQCGVSLLGLSIWAITCDASDERKASCKAASDTGWWALRLRWPTSFWPRCSLLTLVRRRCLESFEFNQSSSALLQLSCLACREQTPCIPCNSSCNWSEDWGADWGPSSCPSVAPKLFKPFST